MGNGTKRLPILALLAALALPARSAEIESLRSLEPLAVNAEAVPEASAAVPGTPADKSLGRFNVYFLSVGQGDSEFIELPNGRTALIDGGPSKAGVSAFLQEHGVSRIDYLVLTHPHSDHYNGLGWVFDNLQVGAFYDTAMDNTGATGDDKVRAKAAQEPGCTTSHPRPGQSLDWGPGVSVKVFNSCPDPVRSDKSDALNDCSIVLKVSAGGKSALFPGDAGAEVEAREVAEYGDELQADFLKVPHHGSQYSSSPEFLQAVRPQYAVISVGENNYGHPTSEAIGNLQAAGARVYRTDRNGTVSGDDLSYELFADAALGSLPELFGWR